MNRIHVLDKATAELIAAGEVVERPASVVKELVENSIDAGATQITVEIKGGGIGYMRITDNGSGIHKDDIPHAFLRHATSKVATAEDLESISTLGFRGEALSSVAAVSRLELTTKTKDSLDGWFYEIHGGSALEIPSPTGVPDGTTFIIRDIFYNTPARMKFLRSDVAEGNGVASTLDKLALSHPEIAFHFIRDTKTRLQTSGNGDLRAVIGAVYGREMAGELLEVDYLFENSIKVKGFVGRPSQSRPNRGYQNFFINHRYVRTHTCSMALQEAFKNKMMTGRFPVCVLFVDLAPALVDANVHPAKIEVRFSQERPIYNSVYFAVQNALEKTESPLNSPSKGSTLRPTSTPFSVDIQVEAPVQEWLKNTNPSGESSINKAGEAGFLSRISLGSTSTIKPPSTSVSSPVDSYGAFIQPQHHPTIETVPLEQKDLAPVTSPLELRFVGELFKTYILLESNKEEFLMVDKHAAHEMLTYEKIKENSVAGVRQVLLSALPVTLERPEYGILLDNLSLLENLGFLVEDFGTGTLLVREAPGVLDGEDLSFLLVEIAGKMLNKTRDLTPEIVDQLYFSIACKASLRGGDKNHQVELEEIIRQLEQNPHITHCPHGRPIVLRRSRQEIEKTFGRLG